MTFRFFRSVTSALLLSIISVAAQTATPAPGATPAAKDEKKPRLGYMRFWNMLPKEVGDLQLVQDSGGPEPTALLTAQPMNIYADYEGMKPGRYALKVINIADPKTILRTFDVILKQDVFVTFFARSENGKVIIEMLDDTYDVEKTVVGKVVIRQYIKDANVTVRSAVLPQPTVIGFGEEKVVDNLPMKAVIFQTQVTMPDGKVRSWSNEINFRKTRHASLFLVLDVYGRFRPKTSIDGQVEVDYSDGK